MSALLDQMPELATIYAEAKREAAPAASREFRAFQERYRHDPAGFAADVVDWGAAGGASPYQVDVLRALCDQRRVAVRAPHGAGKSAIAAIVILWFALTRDGKDWKIATTASVWRQLTEYLWPEVHKWARRLRWAMVGRPAFRDGAELLQLSLKLDTGHAFAVASDNHTAIEGAHADHLLYVFDEAKAIPAEIFDAAEGAFSTTGEVLALSISTPGDAIGRFYEINTRREVFRDWWVRHITLAECVEAGRINQEWADDRRRQWGEGSPLYQNRVLAQFVISSDAAGVIPAAWVAAAMDRWRARVATGGELPRFTGLGVDVGQSADASVIAPRHGNVIDTLIRLPKMDTMQVAGQVRAILARMPGWARVDATGLGAGVYDRLAQLGVTAIAHKGAERADEPDRTGLLNFTNLRSFAYWHARDLLDPLSGRMIELPPDDELMQDLTTPRWSQTGSDAIKVEPKEHVVTRLGRSPDAGDAVVMALLEFKPARRPTPGPVMSIPRG
jgi:hypothetical protein